MPAAAVIPAPIAYIKVVAVKKLVVVFERVLFRGLHSKECDDPCSFAINHWVVPGLN